MDLFGVINRYEVISDLEQVSCALRIAVFIYIFTETIRKLTTFLSGPIGKLYFSDRAFIFFPEKSSGSFQRCPFITIPSVLNCM